MCVHRDTTVQILVHTLPKMAYYKGYLNAPQKHRKIDDLEEKSNILVLFDKNLNMHLPTVAYVPSFHKKNVIWPRNKHVYLGAIKIGD